MSRKEMQTKSGDVRRKVAAALLMDDETWQRLYEAMKWRGWGQAPLNLAAAPEYACARELAAMCDRLSEVTGIDFEVYT